MSDDLSTLLYDNNVALQNMIEYANTLKDGVAKPDSFTEGNIPQFDSQGNIIDSGKSVANVGGGINPNLLDNWYFGNPVNQRGQTSYTGGGYGIDRWNSLNASAVVEITEAGLHLTMGSGCQYKQFFEDYDCFDGKTMTGTILYGDGSLSTGTIKFTTANNDWTIGIHRFFDADSHGITLLITKNHGFTLYSSAAVDCTIVAIKIELGDTQTLAHQENGVWVLNEIPNYAEQLARCRRYLKPLPKDLYMSGWVNQGGTTVHIPFDMSDMYTSRSALVVDAANLTIDSNGTRVAMLTYETDYTFGVASTHFGLVLTTTGMTKLSALKSHTVGVWASTVENKVFVCAEL